jgi:hypothetical protein
MILVAMCSLFCAFNSCNEPFEPKGPFQEQVAVYAILSTQSDTQFVRIYATYNPDGYDPLVNTTDKQVTGATVTVSGPEGMKSFRDTTVTRLDQTRYTTPVHAYVRSAFRPIAGNTYSLSVQLPGGTTARGNVSVPGHGYATAITQYVIDHPEAYEQDIYVSAAIAPRTRGLLLRMFVQFELTVNGKRELRRMEVPASLRKNLQGNLLEKVYPKLQRRANLLNELISTTEILRFTNEAYRTTLQEIQQQFYLQDPVATSVVFLLTQAEPNLYSYYNIVNGFQDDLSIRTDAPDYSTISGGVGIFGAMTVDSSFVSIFK